MARLSRELKAYWHEWDTIELKDDILYKKRFRDVGKDADYLFVMPAVLQKETFRQLHANITGGILDRRKNYDKFRKRFYCCCMHILDMLNLWVQEDATQECKNTHATVQCWIANGTHWT